MKEDGFEISLKDELKIVRDQIINFLKKNNKTHEIINNSRRERLEDFNEFIIKRWKLGYKDHESKNLKDFLKILKESNAKNINIFAPIVKERDYENSEEFKSDKIFEDHQGEVAFLIIFFEKNEEKHYIEIYTEWFTLANHFSHQGPEFNKIKKGFQFSEEQELLKYQEGEKSIKLEIFDKIEKISMKEVIMLTKKSEHIKYFKCPFCSSKDLKISVNDFEVRQGFDAVCPYCNKDIELNSWDMLKDAE